MNDQIQSRSTVKNRRSFLRRGLTAAGAAALLGTTNHLSGQNSNNITTGDISILQFLAAAELIETDLWVQYNELGGIQDSEEPGIAGGSPAYTTALQQLDGDMSQYIHDNTDDEVSHAA